MAWRIADSIIRGVIDNRVRGRVTGHLVLAGRRNPIEFDLVGDCLSDLAGRRLVFTNPAPKPDPHLDLAQIQRGRVGDMTAAYKIRMLDIPPMEFAARHAAGLPYPWHWSTRLFLEWYGEHDGHIVVETADFSLALSDDPTWEMSDADDAAQRAANAELLRSHVERGQNASVDEYDELFSGLEAGEPSPEKLRPCTEEEAEIAQARSDLLTDRISARIAREGADADEAAIIGEEIERLRRELGEPEPTPEEIERRDAWIEEINREAEEMLDDPDFEIPEPEEHPLYQSTREIHKWLDELAEEYHWIPDDAPEEHPIRELVWSVQRAAAKFAGALNGEWPPSIFSCGSKIVFLKRGRVYLDDALRATESCQEEKLIPPALLGPILVEIIDLAHDADEIIAELRERLAEGE